MTKNVCLHFSPDDGNCVPEISARIKIAKKKKSIKFHLPSYTTIEERGEYFVSPDDVYYEVVTDGGKTSYRVIGKLF